MPAVDPTSLVLGLLQAVLVLAAAPLLLGVTKRIKARLAYRTGAPILQPYRDLAKWWRKLPVESDLCDAYSVSSGD